MGLDEGVRAQARPESELRCALCHDALEDDARLRCPGCATMTHDACRAGAGGCPTLGCAHRPLAPRVAPVTLAPVPGAAGPVTTAAAAAALGLAVAGAGLVAKAALLAGHPVRAYTEAPDAVRTGALLWSLGLALAAAARVGDGPWARLALGAAPAAAAGVLARVTLLAAVALLAAPRAVGCPSPLTDACFVASLELLLGGLATLAFARRGAAGELARRS